MSGKLNTLKMSTIKIGIFDEMLTAWESFNISNKAIFLTEHITSDTQETNQFTQKSPLTRSERSKVYSEKELFGFASCYADGMYELRTEIMNHKTFDSEDFLVPVPKVLKPIFGDDRYKFIESYGVGSINSFPVFLGDWLTSKKVCHIDKGASIPTISPCDENYLEFLPYDDFLVVFENGIKIKDSKNTRAVEYKNVMVSRHENNVYFLALPEGMDKCFIKPKYRNLSKKLLNEKKGVDREDFFRRNKLYRNLVVPEGTIDFKYLPLQSKFDINQSSWMCQSTNGIDFPVQLPAEYMESEDLEDPQTKGLELLFRINGLCKRLAESKKLEGVTVATVGGNTQEATPPESKPVQPSEPLKEGLRRLEWNEVPLGEVMGVTSRKDSDGNVRTIFRIGTEVSPHVRRGHWRRLRKPKPDGTTRIWINTMNIRENRIAEVGLRSGKLEISK